MSPADVELRFKGSEAYLQNTAYNTVPLVIHGNGASKLVLNTLGSYLAGAYNPETGCVSCWEDQLELGDQVRRDGPGAAVRTSQTADRTPWTSDTGGGPKLLYPQLNRFLTPGTFSCTYQLFAWKMLIAQRIDFR